MTPTERLRALVRDRMTSQCAACGEVKRMSLRDAARQSGVPFNTLGRFVRGGTIVSDTFDRLTAWVEEAHRA